MIKLKAASLKGALGKSCEVPVKQDSLRVNAYRKTLNRFLKFFHALAPPAESHHFADALSPLLLPFAIALFHTSF
jgi:hypothetical protein